MTVTEGQFCLGYVFERIGSLNPLHARVLSDRFGMVRNGSGSRHTILGKR